MVGATSDKTRVPVTFPPVLSQDNTSVPVCRDTVRLGHLLLTSAIRPPSLTGHGSVLSATQQAQAITSIGEVILGHVPITVRRG